VLIALSSLAATTSLAQALRPLPPEFIATLREIDAATAGVAATVRRFKNEELGIRSPTAAQVDEAVLRVDRGIAQVNSQAEDLRRRESLLLLLSIKGTLGSFSSDLAGFASLLQSSTVRNPGALDRLNRELAELEKSTQAVNAAFRKFDTGAQALLERLDRQAGAQKP
jgi:uncharacterized phage infection (PIP) family protein YhgE